jgi:peroxiredoxin
LLRTCAAWRRHTFSTPDAPAAPQGTLTGLQAKLEALGAVGWDLLAVSADPVDVSTAFVKELGLTFPVACGLTETHMRALGVYMSDPKNYQPQAYAFAEPAFFVLEGVSGVIKYRAEASCPMAARPDVDALLAGFAWSKQNAVEHPEYAGHVWGNKQ